MNQPASVCGPIYTIQCNVCRPVIDGELTMIHFSVWLAEHVVRQTGKSINLVARLCSVRLWVSHVAWTQYSDCQLQTIVTLSCMAHNTLCYLWLPLTRSMSLHICCVCLSVCEWVLVLTQSLTDWLTECTNDDGLYISYTTLQAAALSLSLSLSHSFTATACSVAAVSFLAQINSSSRRWFSARRPRHATPGRTVNTQQQPVIKLSLWLCTYSSHSTTFNTHHYSLLSTTSLSSTCTLC